MSKLFWATGIIAVAMAAAWLAVSIKPPTPKVPRTQMAGLEIERPHEGPAMLEIEPVRVPKGMQLDWQKMLEETPCLDFAGCFSVPGIRPGVQLNAGNQIVGIFGAHQGSGKCPWMTLRQPMPVIREDGMTVLIYAYGWREGFLLRIDQRGDPEFALWPFIIAGRQN